MSSGEFLMRHPFNGDPWGPCSQCQHPAYHKIHTDDIPWAHKTAPDRIRPRECIANARDALNKAYGYDRAAIPLLIEAVDWLRRGLEQMASGVEAQP